MISQWVSCGFGSESASQGGTNAGGGLSNVASLVENLLKGSGRADKVRDEIPAGVDVSADVGFGDCEHNDELDSIVNQIASDVADQQSLQIHRLV